MPFIIATFVLWHIHLSCRVVAVFCIVALTARGRVVRVGVRGTRFKLLLDDVTTPLMLAQAGTHSSCWLSGMMYVAVTSAAFCASAKVNESCRQVVTDYVKSFASCTSSSLLQDQMPYRNVILYLFIIGSNGRTNPYCK